MEDGPPDVELRARVVAGFQAYAAGQSELGREFARHVQLHRTDAAAIVEILRSEQTSEPLTPARLAGRLGLTSGATSILLNRLEEAGHITRTRGHADRRLVTLHTSPAVHEASDAFFAPLREQLDEVVSHYSQEQLELIEGFVAELHRATDAYEPGEQPGRPD